MIPCPSCRRHLRESELGCPFCGAEVHAASTSALACLRGFGAVALSAFALLGSSACSSDATSTDGHTTTAGSTTDTGETTVDDTTTGMPETTTDTDDDPTGNSTSAGSFYAGPDTDFGSASECDPWLQDCPEGEKCVPYASSGVGWDANKCVPVTGDGQPGDACLSGGDVESTDDCDATSICWDTEKVDGQLVGTCAPLCTGTADEPVCAQGSGCLITNNDSLTLCLPTCDPLAQDCVAGQGCYPVDDQLLCLKNSGALVPGDQCGYLNDCPPGSACLDECLIGDCCVPYCSIAAPDCAGFEHECVALFDEPPAGYEDVGVCVAPGCDPLAQDCPDDLACLWLTSDFECAASGAVALGQPCAAASDCAPGGLCLDEWLLPECAGASCCAGLCSLAQPSCGPGTECVAMFDGEPGYEDVGACIEP